MFRIIIILRIWDEKGSIIFTTPSWRLNIQSCHLHIYLAHATHATGSHTTPNKSTHTRVSSEPPPILHNLHLLYQLRTCLNSPFARGNDLRDMIPAMLLELFWKLNICILVVPSVKGRTKTNGKLQLDSQHHNHTPKKRPNCPLIIITLCVRSKFSHYMLASYVCIHIHSADSRNIYAQAKAFAS